MKRILRIVLIVAGLLPAWSAFPAASHAAQWLSGPLVAVQSSPDAYFDPFILKVVGPAPAAKPATARAETSVMKPIIVSQPAASPARAPFVLSTPASPLSANSAPIVGPVPRAVSIAPAVRLPFTVSQPTTARTPTYSSALTATTPSFSTISPADGRTPYRPSVRSPFRPSGPGGLSP